jgi:hypothetical protein
MQFNWYGSEFSAFVDDAMQKALGSGGEFGHAVWDMTAPISDDPRTSGQLRESWDHIVDRFGEGMSLMISANTRYAIYVELGTSKMGPRAPLRTVAGEIVSILPYYIAAELRV